MAGTSARDSKIGNLAALKQVAQSCKSFIESWIGDVVPTVADALDEMENNKADKAEPVSITIPTTGWAVEPALTAVDGYPFYLDVNINGITADDVVELRIAPSSLSAATSCGFCPTQETSAGKVRFRSYEVPTTAIVGKYCIDKAYVLMT